MSSPEQDAEHIVLDLDPTPVHLADHVRDAMAAEQDHPTTQEPTDGR